MRRLMEKNRRAVLFVAFLFLWGISYNVLAKADLERGVVNQPVKRLEFDENVDYPLLEIAEDSQIKEGDVAELGDRISYQITYYNPGPEPQKVTIEDDMGSMVRFVSSEPETDYEYKEVNNTVTWNLPEIAPGELGRVSFTVEVVKNRGGGVGNYAVVSFGEEAGVATNYLSVSIGTEIVSIVQPTMEYDESSEVKYGDGVIAGEKIVYRITYNNFTRIAKDIVIEDKLSERVKFISAQPEGKYEYDEESHTVRWLIEEVPAGHEGNVLLTLEATEEARGIVLNIAEVSVGKLEELSTGAWAENIIYPDRPMAPEMGYSINSDIVDGQEVPIGGEITYEIMYYNHEARAKDVVVVNKLDDNVEFVEAVPATGKYDPDTHTVTWEIENAPSKVKGYVEVTVKVLEEAEDSVSNQAYVSINNGQDVYTNIVRNIVVDKKSTVDPDPVDPPEPIDKQPKIGYSPDSQVGENWDVQAGNQIGYRIAFYNYEDKLNNIVITNKLDKNVKFIRTESSFGTTVYDEEEHLITYTAEGIPYTAEGYLDIIVEVTESAEGTVYNQAAVKLGDNPEILTDVLTNPVVYAPVTIPTPVMRMDPDSQVKQDEYVSAGDKLSYQITYTNYEADTRTITITDPLDPGVKFVSASPAKSYNYDSSSHTIIWTLSDVAAGDEGYVSLTVEVTKDAKTKITNQASVAIGTAAGTSTNTLTNYVVEPGVEMTPVKDYNPKGEVSRSSEVEPGDEIQYEIAFYNHESTALPVIVTDKLDSGVTFVSAGPENLYEYDEARHTVVWTIGNVAAETVGVLEVVVKVSEDAGNTVNNQARVKLGSHAEVNTNVLSNTVVTPNTPKTPIKVIASGSETARNQTVQTGSNISYEIGFYNHEPEACDVVVTDKLDEGVTFVSAAPADFYVYDADSHTVTWTLPRAAAEKEGVVSLSVQVNSKASESVTNKAVAAIGSNAGVETNTLVNPLAAITGSGTGTGADNNNNNNVVPTTTAANKSTGKADPVSNSPKTGDDMSVMPVAILLLASASAIIYLLKRRR